MRADRWSNRCRFKAILVSLLLTGWFMPSLLRAQVPMNPLREAESPAPSPAENPAPNPPPSSAKPRLLRTGSVRPKPAAEPHRFTPYDVWGEDVATDDNIRLAQATEELPPPAGAAPPGRVGWPTLPQAVTEEQWADVGPLDMPAEDGGHGSIIPPWFMHTDPNDPHRHIGMGQPLIGTSWRNRPWYIGTFIGGVFNNDLIANRVQPNNSSLLGLRLGWDFDHYWGLEGRFAFSNPNTYDGTGNALGDSHNYLVDIELLYYPWGDSRWRPYFTAGMGIATYRFADDQGRSADDSLLSLPVGLGLKYFHSPWFTLRLDAVENFAAGSRLLDGQANFSLMAGVEYRFGGRRPSYFPLHGDLSGW